MSHRGVICADFSALSEVYLQGEFLEMNFLGLKEAVCVVSLEIAKVLFPERPASLNSLRSK